MTVSEHIAMHLEGSVWCVSNHKSLRLCPVCVGMWGTGLALLCALLVYIPGDSVCVNGA